MRPYQQFDSPSYQAEQMAEDLVNSYNRNPHQFDEDQGRNIAYLAARYNLDFKPESKALKKFAYALANSASLGGLSLAMDAPTEVGEEYGFGSTGGKIAGGLGELAGFAVPLAGGVKLAKAGLKGLSRLAPSAAKRVSGTDALSGAVQGAATGAGAMGLSNALGDPSGIMEDAAYGAVGGATLGALASRFRSRPETFNMYGNEVPKIGNMGPYGNRVYGSGSPINMGSGQAQLGQGGANQLPMGRVPREWRMPQGEPISSGKPINLGQGTPPHMTAEMEAVVNAIRNLRGQANFGNRVGRSRVKSAQDNLNIYGGDLVY